MGGGEGDPLLHRPSLAGRIPQHGVAERDGLRMVCGRKLEDDRFLVLSGEGLAADLEARLAEHLSDFDAIGCFESSHEVLVFVCGACHVLIFLWFRGAACTGSAAIYHRRARSRDASRSRCVMSLAPCLPAPDS